MKKKVYTAADVIEARRIIAELKKRGIEGYTKDGGPDDYVELNGISVYGKGIYVEAEDVSQAKEFLKEIEGDDTTPAARPGEDTIDKERSSAYKDNAERKTKKNGKRIPSAGEEEYVSSSSGAGKIIAGTLLVIIIIIAVVAVVLMK